MVKKQYGKLINGNVIFYNWRTIFDINGIKRNTSDPKILLTNGYKEVIFVAPSPNEGYVTSSYTWTETETQLIQTWHYTEYVESETSPSFEERLEATELALLELAELVSGGE